MNGLFQKGVFRLASGKMSDFKIDCDALEDEEIECLAFMLSRRLKPFSMVEGVATGGLRLAQYMRAYVSEVGPLLIVDDVFSTGGSIKRAMYANGWNNEPHIGAVLFARGVTPDWITPLFILTPEPEGGSFE